MGAALQIAETIRQKAKRILEGKAPTATVERELRDMVTLDLQQIRQLEKEISDYRQAEDARAETQRAHDLQEICKNVFQKATEAIQAVPSRQDHLQELLKHIILLEDLEIAQLIKVRTGQAELRTTFENLLSRRSLDDEDVDTFLQRMRGLVSTRVSKLVKRALRRKMAALEEQLPPGPRVSDNDTRRAAQAIVTFFESDPLVRQALQDESIGFYLYGSLVTGYSNSPKKQGQPSDHTGVSDVDLLVVLSTRLFDALFGSLPKGLLFDSRGMRTTAPSGVDGKLAIHNTGPFQGIFERLHGLMFAGRNDRPIHLVFTDTDTFHKQDQLHRIAV
ncbi:hypothetical protein HY490_01270, partial [Candidatus Woesearchaeota archaeon]|nr:hypothetical protein [Candidatus Woesearchaeota archaeon]